MRIISHRGNLHGPRRKKENKPSYIDDALLSFDAEIDVWYDKGWWLGHDEPQYKVSREWLNLRCDRLWMHCKNLKAFDKALDTDLFNCFWHEGDAYTLTSCGFIWTYPGQPTRGRCVLVDLKGGASYSDALYGVCTDYPMSVL